MLYNIVLFSAVHPSESAVYIHPLPLEPPSPPHHTPPGPHRAPSRALLPFLCPKIHSLWLHLYSFLADRFISTTFLDSIDIIFHPIDIILIYDIYFSHSDMLHPVWQTLGPSASLQMSEFYSFLLQSDIPLYRRIPFKLGDFDKVYCPL